MKKNILFIFVLLPVLANSQLKINEIMPKNVSGIMDDSYNCSMWVELFNTSKTTSYDQGLYYFTDKLKDPKKWKPEAGLIAPEGFSILWFERPEIKNHATFKLEPSGGKLYLLNEELQVVDSVIYPAQYRNVSYGRKTDGVDEWVFFDQYSAGTSNNGKKSLIEQSPDPVFETTGGFYSSAIHVKFVTPAAGDTIYYTTNSSEPTLTNSTYYIPDSEIPVDKTTNIRAKCISAQKLPGNVVTSTFFIGERNFNLPVVSIVTNQANLTNDTIGIYVAGTNGKTGFGMSTPVNWNQDWDRAANFELFDTTKVVRLNQELDISIAGSYSRVFPEKSLKINPKKKFGNNKLPYDIFKTTKPNHNYRSILLRNSGSDFQCSMMRDAFMQSLIIKRMDLDYQAYEPAICFLNGVYSGIENLRERSDEDLIYSNYGLNEEDITLLERREMNTDTGYLKLTDYVTNNDVTNDDVYKNVGNMMDVDNYMSYFLSEIYYGNDDWPDNNVKSWKKNVNGKWRWILFDTDNGFNLYDFRLYNVNSLSVALGEDPVKVPESWSTILLRRLILNETFRNKFIDRFSIHLSSTFETNRVNHIMDSLAAKIRYEIAFHKAKYGDRDFEQDLIIMKHFSLYRPDKMLGFISDRFLNSAAVQAVEISSNNDKATYKLNNEAIIDPKINLKTFKNRSIVLEANPIAGFKFKQWELLRPTSFAINLSPYGSNWKYFDGSSTPATNWTKPAYNDEAWKSGDSPLGYVSNGVVTTISYGPDVANKYPTAYFRKNITINDIDTKLNYLITVIVDDGAAIYVNGTEIGRSNLPGGPLLFNTLTPISNNNDTVTFNVPRELIKEGNNVIAVEVHQNTVISSDMFFNFQLTCDEGSKEISANPAHVVPVSKEFYKAVYEESVIQEPDTIYNVVLNEFVSSNSLIQDEFGGKDDYIELYNNGSEAVNIAGWYLTDTPSNRTLSQVPATDLSKTLIPSKGRIVIWADDQSNQGVLHAGFKLSQNGETVFLSKRNNSGNLIVVDSVAFPFIDSNMSYSRVPDGAANWVIQAPTFNVTNSIITGVVKRQETIRVYPTLVNETINIENAQGQKITLIDLTGTVIIERNCQSFKEQIQIGQLQRGVYIVVVGAENYKIVKL